MTKIQGGYVLISVGQFANVCAARRDREISFLALRVWLAAHEQRAKRCLAKKKYFTVIELARLVRERASSVERALRELTRSELLVWTQTTIEFPRDLTAQGEEFAEDFGTSPRRPVPVPRRVLRALFRHTRPSEVLAAIAHLIRCLFIRAGRILSGGLVKASWVAFTFEISERSVHAARKWLLSLGFLAQEQVHQLVLNRHGGKFVFVFEPPAQQQEALRLQTESAPPSKTISTYLSTNYNQINNKPAPAAPGVRVERSNNPILRDIQPEDLKKPARLEELYRQAVRAGWITHSEASIRNFACAALRATRAGGRVGAIFVGIVKNRLWRHVTQEQEDRALTVLKRFRDRHGSAFGNGEAREAETDTRIDQITDLVAPALTKSERFTQPMGASLQAEAERRKTLLAQASKNRSKILVQKV
jgi:hypothetical protein